MTDNLPLCSIVVINYNGKDLLAQFLPSVVNLHYPNKEVIVVDNASMDGSAEFVEAHFPEVKVVRSAENLGTAEGSNLGARHAHGEYIFWVSNDMELAPDLLDYLIETAESDPKIGICTCKMRRITAEGEKLNIIDSVGANVDRFGFPDARGINQPDRGQLDHAGEVFFSFGGAMLIKRSVLEHIGGYDSALFTLGDDIDLCWRAHLAGYKVVVDPRAVLYHRVSATLGSSFGRSRKRYWSERHTLRVLLKNYAVTTLLWVLPCYLALLLAEICFFCVLRKFAIARADLEAVLWNIRKLPETLRLRREVQHLRRIPDREVQKRMLKRPQKLILFFDFVRNSKAPHWRGYFGEGTKVA